MHLLGGPKKANLSFLVPWIYFLDASKLTVYPLQEVHRAKLFNRRFTSLTRRRWKNFLLELQTMFLILSPESHAVYRDLNNESSYITVYPVKWNKTLRMEWQRLDICNCLKMTSHLHSCRSHQKCFQTSDYSASLFSIAFQHVSVAGLGHTGCGADTIFTRIFFLFFQAQ